MKMCPDRWWPASGISTLPRGRHRGRSGSGWKCCISFGMEASRVDLEKGKIEFWVEKSDVWHTVCLFPPTVEFLREFLAHHHPSRLDRDLMLGDSRFLMPSLGVPSGPDVRAAAHKSG